MSDCIFPGLGRTVDSVCCYAQRVITMVEGAFEEISAQNSEDKYKEKTHHKHIDHWRD